jgi:hypothetical protein
MGDSERLCINIPPGFTIVEAEPDRLVGIGAVNKDGLISIRHFVSD